jgi:hypothetical protein
MTRSINLAAARAAAKACGVEIPEEPRRRSKGTRIDLEAFCNACVRYGLPRPTPECKFHPARDWRVDFAWWPEMLALEVEGGAWVQGRHNRGSGFVKDIEKYNELAIRGWRLIRATPQDVIKGRVFPVIARALGVE